MAPELIFNQAIQKVFSIPLMRLFGEVPEFKAVSIYCLLGFLPHLSILLIICCVMEYLYHYSVHFWCLRIHPLLTQNIFVVLLSLPVGPVEMTSCVRGIKVLDGYGSLYAQQYKPKDTCQCFFRSKVILTTIIMWREFGRFTILDHKYVDTQH